MITILIVEDEKGISELLKRTLNMSGYHSFQAFTGLEAIRLVKKENVDLVLLDINLPDINGFKVLKEMGDIPVIYLTARDEIPDKVKGLSQGAEDYIVKPFDINELLARIQVVLRRYNKEEKAVVIGASMIDLEKHTVFLEEEKVELTNQEFELLKILVRNRNMALSRNKLLDLAWGMDYFGDERTVDVHIQRLRKKLKLENYIKTVYKFGYRLEI